MRTRGTVTCGPRFPCASMAVALTCDSQLQADLDPRDALPAHPLAQTARFDPRHEVQEMRLADPSVQSDSSPPTGPPDWDGRGSCSESTSLTAQSLVYIDIIQLLTITQSCPQNARVFGSLNHKSAGSLQKYRHLASGAMDIQRPDRVVMCLIGECLFQSSLTPLKCTGTHVCPRRHPSHAIRPHLLHGRAKAEALQPGARQKGLAVVNVQLSDCVHSYRVASQVNCPFLAPACYQDSCQRLREAECDVRSDRGATGSAVCCVLRAKDSAPERPATSPRAAPQSAARPRHQDLASSRANVQSENTIRVAQFRICAHVCVCVRVPQ